jgi:hypothetical protein
MNQTFDLRRSLALLRLNFHLNRKGLQLAIGGFLGFVFITSFFVARGNPAGLNTMHIIFWFIYLFGGAAIMAGSSFNNMSTPDKAMSYLGLPASVFEKYLIPLFVSGILWILFAMGSYLLYSMLLNHLWAAVLGFSYSGFQPFNLVVPDQTTLEVYLQYMVIHSIFFLGAAAFKRFPIPKTLLTGFLLNSYFTFLSLILVFILFGGFIQMGEAMTNLNLTPEAEKFISKTMPELVKVSFLYILPVILYIAAFFKIKEREV